MFLKTLVLPAALAALTGLAGPALAQRDDPNLKKYCTGDYLKFCGNLAPEDPALDRCFERNMKALSVNCRGAIDFYEKNQKAGRKS